jgi:hypothetical protein
MMQSLLFTSFRLACLSLFIFRWHALDDEGACFCSSTADIVPVL